VKNREHCGAKLPLAILKFLINFNQHTLSPEQDSNTGPPIHKQSCQSLTPHTLTYKDSISHDLQHQHTGSLLSSLQHTLQSTTLYTDRLSELLTLPAVWSDNRHCTGTELLVWTPPSGPVFISSRLKSRTTRTQKNPDLCLKPSNAFSYKYKDGVYC
jgi:hypothetical protein